MPSVTEVPLEHTMKRTPDNDQRQRAFDVEALSHDDALSELNRVKGITDGTAYRDQNGDVDTNLRAREFDVKPRSVAGIGYNRLYRVNARYRVRKNTNQTNPKPRAGTNEVKYIWGRGEEMQTVEKDLDGVPIKNSKGELYNPPPSRLITHRTLLIRWWVHNYNLLNIFDYDGVANSDNWKLQGKWDIEPGRALSHGINPGDETETQTMLEWQIEFRPSGLLWTPLAVLDYTVESGVRILLDGSGNALPDGDDPVTGEAKWYYGKAFGTWGV